MVEITIPGRPQPWQRTGGQGARRYTRRETAAYEARVAMLARAAMRGSPPLSGPLEVAVTAVWPRPKRRPDVMPPEAWATGTRAPRPSKPDADNVAKGILDGLTRGRVIGDDGQVVRLVAETLYAAEGEGPHVEVRVVAVGWVA